MEKLNNVINAVMAFIDKITEKITNISFFNIKLPAKTIAIIFGVIVILIATVSGIFVVGELLSEDPEDITTDPSTEVIEVIPEFDDIKGNFLLALTYHDKIELLAVARLDSAEKEMKVSFLSPDTYCSFNNLSGTMNQHYEKGGTTELLWAVGEYAHISIERYLIADENTFLSLMEHMGEAEVNLKHEVICGQDAASFVIEAGYQTLIPTMMSKYFYYLCENQPGYNEEIVDVMGLFSKKLFNSQDRDSTQKNFEYMISCLETNISALDFNNYKEPIITLADPAVLDSITIEEDLSNFR